MPTVLRSGPYRLFFYAGDRDELPHVHVERDDCEAKFWLDPVRFARSQGFAAKEINQIGKLIVENQRVCWMDGMNFSTVETKVPTAISAQVSDDTLSVGLSDGRSISVPLAWYPRLSYGTPDERNNWRLIGNGHGIHWCDLDEDISVANL